MTLAIIQARVLDPSSGTIREGQTVVLEGGTIRAIEAGPPPKTAERVIDARGKILMPGLIDAHVHFCSFADSPDEETQGVTPETIASSTLRGAASAARMLASGVTTARDLGCKHPGIFALRRAFSSRQHPGPRLVVAGAGVTMTGGTGHRSCAWEADGPDAVRHAARAQVRAGADVVKLFISGGVLHPSASEGGTQFTREELSAGIEEAHRAGKPAVVHGSWDEALRMAVELGANSVEHGHEITEAVAATMAAQEIFLVPTLWHYRRIALHGVELGASHLVVERARQVTGIHGESFVRALRAGVPIAAGTDSGGPRYPSGSLHLELQYMSEQGMSPMEVLRAATSQAARCLRLEREAGRLEPGFAADMVGVAEDPTRNLGALARPWLVVKAGEVVAQREE